MDKNKELLSRIAEKTIRNRAYVDASLIDIENRTIPFIIVSSENGNTRYDWWEDKEFEEVLDVNGAKFDELNTFFKDHEHSTDTAIGKVVNTRVDGGQIKADVIFGTDAEAEKIFRKYVEGILTDVSIGYSINAIKTESRDNMIDLVTVLDYNIVELSAVWRGFDRKAKVGRAAEELKEAEAKEQSEKELISRKQQVSNRMRLIEMSL